MAQRRDHGSPMSVVHVQEEDLLEMSTLLKSSAVVDVTDKVQSLLGKLEATTLDIAVTGESGAGKSTFVNALRGLGDDDFGAARTGVTETTTVPMAYQHPTLPTVRIWDMPGIGTYNFQVDQYLKLVNFERYDFFIIVASERFRENHARLARNIRDMKKHFYFVRTKVDQDLNACTRRKKTQFNEEMVLNEIRTDCTSWLEKEGEQDPKVFLLSSFELHKYDFQKLQNTLEQSLDGQKRHVLLLSLPNITDEVIVKKKKSLKRHIWKKALLSCIISAMPSKPVHFNIPMLMNTLRSYKQNFGLDDESLGTLASKVNTSTYHLKEEITSQEGQGMNEESVKAVLRMAVVGSQAAANLVEEQVPVLGNLVAGAITFVAVYILLNSSLDNLAKDAQKVLRRAFSTEDEEKLEAYQKLDPGFLYD
ncbi:interferon-inducible GTPase 5-like [Ambystoma mexicanum]|uniref:interferon-inducible GTPase 5-like n=1 Tax=Ambystoma mexicanum TaxID=8296 RepID=UPI0037E76C55